MIPPKTTQNLEQDNALEHLKGLHELIERMNSVYELQELLEFVADKALSLTGGYRGLLLLSDDHERTLRDIALVRGEKPDDQRLEAALEAVSSTVIKDVLERGEPRLVSDLLADRRYEGLTSQKTLKLKKIRSVLAVPLKIEQELVGLIYIDHPKKANFNQSDLYFLSAFANQAAIAINRAREHQRQVEVLTRLNQRKIEELTRLNELSRSVVQVLDLDKVLTNIVDAATEILNVETGSVLLLDETKSELVFATSVSNGKANKIPARLHKDQGIAGWVVSTGQPVCLNDLSKDPRWYGEVEVGFETQSLLCVPLQSNGRILGVLQVLNTKKREGFGNEDIALMSAFAASATIAIENARLYREARQARQLRSLNELALALNRTLDLRTILKIGLGQSLALLDADVGLISLYDDQLPSSLFPLQLTEGLSAAPELAQAQATILQKLIQRAIENDSAEVFVIDDFQMSLCSEFQPLREVGILALALAPIKVGQHIRGGLLLAATRPQVYGEESFNLLAGIAHIVSLAVQNAIHYLEAQERATQLERLNEIGQALTRGVSGFDLASILRMIINGVNATLRTERASVFLINEETQELVLDCTNEGEVDIRLPAPWSGSIAGWVARNNQSRIVNDPLNDPEYLSYIADSVGYKIHSLLCTPIVVEGRVIGVIEALNRKDGQPFHAKDREELVEFAKWAAIAIHNARLFEQRLQAYQRLANEQRRRHAAEARSAMAAIILDIAHTMNNIIGAIRFWSLELQDEPLAASQIRFKEGLAEILRNAEEAIELIGKARNPIEKAAIGPTNVQGCLAKAIQNCAWPGHIRRRELYSRDLPPVRANDSYLESVFHNLLRNAIHALNGQGGEIRIVTGYSPQGWVEIKISDNGPGIPPELQERLFDSQVSSKEEGLGLGLWLVKTFIHQFEGLIDFTTSATEGTTFVITLQPWFQE
jgi:GAF domain-containing protein